MRRSIAYAVQISFCLCGVATCLVTYLDRQNELTKLRLRVPKLVKEIQLIEEENTHLKYQVQKFESPEHLMNLAHDAQYSHLKQPLSQEVLVVESPDGDEPLLLLEPKESLAAGVK